MYMILLAFGQGLDHDPECNPWKLFWGSACGPTSFLVHHAPPFVRSVDKHSFRDLTPEEEEPGLPARHQLTTRGWMSGWAGDNHPLNRLGRKALVAICAPSN
jgi:hypothetical protein